MTLASLPSPNFTGADVSTRLNAVAQEARAARRLTTVAALLADTTLGYTGGRAVTPGDIVEAGGFRYQVAASAATDQHVTIAGGVKLYALPRDGVITPEQFGCIGNGVANDAAAFRAAWLAMRASWYVSGTPLKLVLTGKYLLTSPVQDRSGVATLVMDFAGEILGLEGSEIRVSGVSGFIVQVGTYASNANRRKVSGLYVRSMDGLQKGVCFDALFQGNTKVENVTAQGTLADLTVSNCQEMFARGLKSLSSLEKGFHIANTGISRAEGSNNSYTAASGTSISNNNEFEVFVQSPAQRGIHIQGGTQNKILGLVQGAGSDTFYFVDIEETPDIHLDNLWLESSNANHRELITRSTFTGRLLMTGVRAETIGAYGRFEGGTIIVSAGGGWRGRWEILAPAQVITDTNTAQGYLGTRLPLVLNVLQPIQGATDTATGGSPQNRRLFYKGTVAAGGSFRFFSGGKDASGNESKGFVARVHLWNTAGTAQCTAVFYVDGRGTYPAVRSLIEEKLGALADCSATLTSTRAGSTPFHILYGDLGYSGAATLRYEITVEPFEH